MMIHLLSKYLLHNYTERKIIVFKDFLEKGIEFETSLGESVQKTITGILKFKEPKENTSLKL